MVAYSLSSAFSAGVGGAKAGPEVGVGAGVSVTIGTSLLKASLSASWSFIEPGLCASFIGL